MPTKAQTYADLAELTAERLTSSLANQIGFLSTVGQLYKYSYHEQLMCTGHELLFMPGEVASCPIGALQGVIGSYEYKFPFFVAGILILFGSFMGCFVCGWLCPFGLIQDLLNKIPLLKKLKIKTFKGDKQLRWLKYIILVVFVILLPLRSEERRVGKEC